ncbi:MAG: type II toxin-antitoxin system RelE/ParE family toxin [Candidatus Aenigmarchaeota archaeon]|nr:type II toxin-antitoxin system RelE/ParE family toxin [Candidatus Aenigmarchaeota archaeon]
MDYMVKLHPKAAALLRRLPEPLAERIRQKLLDTASNPFQYLEHFAGQDVYKLRIGDYRALIDVDFERNILWVRVLDKRGRIYKR